MGTPPPKSSCLVEGACDARGLSRRPTRVHSPVSAPRWRQLLEGLWDGRPQSQWLLVSRSAPLDFYRYGSELLQGPVSPPALASIFVCGNGRAQSRPVAGAAAPRRPETVQGGDHEAQKIRLLHLPCYVAHDFTLTPVRVRAPHMADGRQCASDADPQHLRPDCRCIHTWRDAADRDERPPASEARQDTARITTGTVRRTPSPLPPPCASTCSTYAPGARPDNGR
jgi:hypothetical protein